MKLLTVGDSFTYGDELVNRETAWPYVLAKLLNCEVTNLGAPAESNDYILRTVISESDNYDIIIMAWTHYARIELADNMGAYSIWPGCSGNMFNGLIDYRKNVIKYYTVYNNDQYYYNRYIDKILLMQKYLKDKKFLMLDAFGNNTARRLSNRTDQIDTTHFIGWPNETMMEWTYGCPQGPNRHFLEEGHLRVADKIYEHIRHLGWIS